MRLGKRGWIIVGVAVPLIAFIALLAWASVRSGGNPGSLGVNNEFGQVAVEEESAREFSLELMDGNTINISDYLGRVVLLDFWASWCRPCQQEAPTLAQVYREMQGPDMEFIGIDIWDGIQDARDHIERFDVPYPNGLDSTGTIAIDYGVRGIPEKIFIGKDGKIAKKFVGPISPDSLRETLNELLARK